MYLEEGKASNLLWPQRERVLYRKLTGPNLLFTVEMIWWASVAPWEFEFPFPDSLVSIFLDSCTCPGTHRAA